MSTETADRNQSHGHDQGVAQTVDAVNEFVQTVVNGFNEIGAPDQVVDEIDADDEPDE